MRAQVYPVVHHRDAPTTLKEGRLALALGADGVFLISHGGKDAELIPLGHALMADYPHRLIGVNFLGLDAADALGVCIQEGFRALWVDNAGITSQGATAEGRAFAQRAQAQGILVFASVAFKYQNPEPQPGEAARQAVALQTLPTTSGPGTGSAPDVAKIAAMRAALDPSDRLAIASGMTPENLDQFLPYATDFLVATGVSLNMHHFNPQHLQAFIEKAHGGAD